MTKKVLLGAIIGGVVLGTILPLSVTVFAGIMGITPLAENGNKIIIDDDEIEIVKFNLDGSPETGDVFGGYGALAANSLLVVTSHPGFYDSEKQDAPSDAQTFRGISETAAVCNTSNGVCEKVWHTHLANLIDDTLAVEKCVSDLRVDSLTFEEPSEKVRVKSSKIIVKEVEGDDDFINSLTAQEMEFLLGTYADNLVSFDLIPANLTPPEPVVVCVENIQAVEVLPPDDDDDDDD